MPLIDQIRSHTDADLLSSAIDEAMARFSLNCSGTETNANYRGCQPYEGSARPPASGGFRGGPPPPVPDALFRKAEQMNSSSIDPQQIIAQILSNKNRVDRNGGGSSSNNSSSSRTGISSSNHIIKSKSHDNCDNMTLQSEYENVRPPMRLPTSSTPMKAESDQVTSGKGRRRLGRQESRYTSGKVFIGYVRNSARIPSLYECCVTEMSSR